MARAAVAVSTSLSLKLSSHPLSSFSPSFTFSTFHTPSKKNKSQKEKQQKKKASISTITIASSTSNSKFKSAALEAVKRRTRSDKEFDEAYIKKYGDRDSHIPVMLGEVLDVFPSSSFRLRSFVDCTLGAAGHSCAMIQAHPELQTYIGLDVDPMAHEKAQSRIEIKQVIGQVEEKLLLSGVDGILMDLGMSSMQGILKAEDILNSWPPAEVGRILREYGEESNWYSLQIKIAKARLGGGFHSTSDLVDLIRGKSAGVKGGRQGWIKTAARVFQALRIAVNDELKTLENSLYSCFDCLSPGGRLAVISFHSLEDRIVKQTFLNIINNNIQITAEEEGGHGVEPRKFDDEPTTEKEAWIKQVVKGPSGIILTKRPITASAEEEKLNSRCRSAKLRVIQKL
ncbi:Ribosomal RNA small subunit methyltransferase H [Bienertia sinuspersici]